MNTCTFQRRVQVHMNTLADHNLLLKERGHDTISETAAFDYESRLIKFIMMIPWLLVISFSANSCFKNDIKQGLRLKKTSSWSNLWSLFPSDSLQPTTCLYFCWTEATWSPMTIENGIKTQSQAITMYTYHTVIDFIQQCTMRFFNKIKNWWTSSD